MFDTDAEGLVSGNWFEYYREVVYGLGIPAALGRYRRLEILYDLIDECVKEWEELPEGKLLRSSVDISHELENIVYGVANSGDVLRYQTFIEWGWEQIFTNDMIQTIFEVVFRPTAAISIAIQVNNGWNILAQNIPLLREIIGGNDLTTPGINQTISSIFKMFPGIDFSGCRTDAIPDAHQLLIKAAKSSDIAHHLLIVSLLPSNALANRPNVVRLIIRDVLLYSPSNLGYYAVTYPEETQELLTQYIAYPSLDNPPWIGGTRKWLTRWWSYLSDADRQIQRDYAECGIIPPDTPPSIWQQLCTT
jgi:hypothetical protein